MCFWQLILGWPFLAFSAFIIFLFVFGGVLKQRIEEITELKLGEKATFKLGNRELERSEIDEAITETFQEMASRIEALEAELSSASEENNEGKKKLEADEISPEVAEFLWSRVYPMLNSDLWFARYIDTLAKNTATSPELMEKFLRNRPDVKIVDDGGRPAAHLRDRGDWSPSRSKKNQKK